MDVAILNQEQLQESTFNFTVEQTQNILSKLQQGIAISQDLKSIEVQFNDSIKPHISEGFELLVDKGKSCRSVYVNHETNEVIKFKLIEPNDEDTFENDHSQSTLVNIDSEIELIDFAATGLKIGVVKMPYLGKPLAEITDLTTQQFHDIFKMAMEQFQMVHDANHIHNDINPGNLLVVMDEQGTVEHVSLIDFELSKRCLSFETVDITKFNNEFSSPEMQNDQEATHASDIYSLAKVMSSVADDNKLALDPATKITLDNMLEEDPDDRYDDEAVLHALQKVDPPDLHSSASPY